jgi:hypothetical protein
MNLAIEDLHILKNEFEDDFTTFFTELIEFTSKKIKEINQSNQSL